MIAILDYGMGNTGAIKNMLRRIGYNDVLVTNSKEEILIAEKYILPGVGSFDSAMQAINNLSLLPILNDEVIKNKKPILGICLGMQLFTKGSEEGSIPGFGWIEAQTHKFTQLPAGYKVPHMSWQTVKQTKDHAILKSLSKASKFYFVHSYYVVCDDLQDILLTTNYGVDFTCSIQHDNIIGVQFHPEKSHKYGMQLMKNFADL